VVFTTDDLFVSPSVLYTHVLSLLKKKNM